MRTLTLSGAATSLRLLGFILALTFATVGHAAAQDCRLADPPCPPDEPPGVVITPEGGTYSSAVLDVSIHMRDDYGLSTGTFEVTFNGESELTTGAFSFNPGSASATTARADGRIVLQPGSGNVLTARICDFRSVCESTSVTYTYTPPPPPPAKGAPLLDLGALHNPELRVPSAFDAGLGYSTPAYVSLDVPRSVGIAYSSELASPTGFVQVDASPNSGTLPDRMSIAVLDGAGKPVRLTSRTTENFYGSITGPTRLAAQWDASGLATGAYSYTVVVRNWWGTEFRETRQSTRVLVVNERQSPVGAGWMVAGLQRLHVQADGSVVLASGDGSASVFTAGACGVESCQYGSPAGDFSTLTRILVRDAGGAVASQLFRRRFVDGGVLTYTSDGRLSEAEDRFQNRMRYGYDAAGRLTSVTDPLGLATTLHYDAAGKLASIRDPGGRSAEVAIDRAGDLVRITDPDGVVALRARYGAGHRVAQRWDRAGGGYGFDYDRAGKLARTLSPGVQTDSGVVRLEVRTRSWEAAALPGEGLGSFAQPAARVAPENALAKITDTRGDSTRIAFDRWGLPARVVDHEGKASTTERNGAGQVIRSTDAQGIMESYTWNGPDLTSISNPVVGSVTEIHYEPVYHQVKAVYRNEELQLTNFYGATALLDSTRADTSVTRYTYDGRGRVLSVTDPEGHRSSVAYQSVGMQNTASATVVRGTETRTTTFAYDALGRVERVTDPATRVVTTAYDTLNRTIRVTGPDSTVVRYGYDDATRTFTLTDPKEQTYRTVSNALGWVESQTDPRGLVERFGYDRHGNLTRYTNRRGQHVITAYDSVGRVRTRVADGDTTRFRYDPDRLWVAVENAEGADTLRTDDSGRPLEAVSVRNGSKYVIASGYGEQGLRNTLTVTGPWGTRQIASLGYDDAFRLNYFRAFTDTKAAGITYTPDQLVERVTLPTGTATDTTRLRMSFGYTPLHATARIEFNRPSVEAVLGRSYGHDVLERIATITRKSPLGGHEQRALAYDSLGRLIRYADVRLWESSESVCEPVTSTQLPECHPVSVEHADTLRRERYTYDKAGNRTDRGAVLETGNRLTSFGGYTMQYDDDGNLVRKFRLEASGAITYDQTLSWNSLGQLRSVTSNGITTTFGYSGWGQRVRKTTGGVTTLYLWDGDDLVMELGGTGTPLREYAYYPGIDQPHAVRRVSDGAVFRYTQEQPGHVSGLVGAGSVVVNEYAYTPWGEPIRTQEQVEQPLRYAAREYDAETGLYYVRARYYDPQQGRFVSADPIGLEGGLNLYAYAATDPVNLTDPTGLSPCTEVQVRQMREIGTSEELIQLICGATKLPGITVYGRPSSASPHGPGATSSFGNPNARGSNLRALRVSADVLADHASRAWVAVKEWNACVAEHTNANFGATVDGLRTVPGQITRTAFGLWAGGAAAKAMGDSNLLGDYLAYREWARSATTGQYATLISRVGGRLKAGSRAFVGSVTRTAVRSSGVTLAFATGIGLGSVGVGLYACK